MFAMLTQTVQAERLYIECCDLWKAVSKFVVVSTGEDAAVCPVPCKTYSMVRKFVKNISPMLQDFDDPLNGTTYYVAHEDIFPSQKVSDVLAWSILGRLCSTHNTGKQEQGKYIQFEPSTGVLSIIHAGCEYQRSIYSTLMSLCIIVILFILTGMTIRKSIDEKKALTQRSQGPSPPHEDTLTHTHRTTAEDQETEDHPPGIREPLLPSTASHVRLWQKKVRFRIVA